MNIGVSFGCGCHCAKVGFQMEIVTEELTNYTLDISYDDGLTIETVDLDNPTSDHFSIVQSPDEIVGFTEITVTGAGLSAEGTLTLHWTSDSMLASSLDAYVVNESLCTIYFSQDGGASTPAPYGVPTGFSGSVIIMTPDYTTTVVVDCDEIV